jgi:hypothetical protein
LERREREDELRGMSFFVMSLGKLVAARYSIPLISKTFVVGLETDWIELLVECVFESAV